LFVNSKQASQQAIIAFYKQARPKLGVLKATLDYPLTSLINNHNYHYHYEITIIIND